ncbi:PEPxxWA-CTERM sorting domain-containing protein [Phenylobacterium sp.]|uniref:PEPxxWA-CTERM sorting domain-containing protein n=1 Tax=Phenylobacterium sp. TaxID=1871053 RepID=UPI0025CE0411|nr:PEPxxWA-CTERM sorting domain-containing protein [Phenylobacterium sp.]
MKFEFLSGVGAMAVLSAALAGPANAVVSYDSLTGSTFTGGGFGVGAESNPFTGFDGEDAGVEFEATATGYIDSLKLALYGATSGQVIIYADNGKNQLGTQLETLSLSESTTTNSFATGSYTGGVQLQQGQKYWVLDVGPTTNPFLTPFQTWNEFNTPTPDPLFLFEGQSITCCSSVITSGTYTGPGSVDSFGMILDIASARGVPEPATWTMLIAGFGMVGAALRRRAGTLASA